MRVLRKIILPETRGRYFLNDMGQWRIPPGVPVPIVPPELPLATEDYVLAQIRKLEEEKEINDLMESYSTMMMNERHTSDRRGFEIR